MKTNSLRVVILTLFLAGCTGHSPALKPITKQSVVVAFGDSLTAGTGVTKDQAYPAILSSLLGCTVINEGIPGETTSEGLARLPELLQRLKPTLVIVCFGGNDFLRDVREATTRDNLTTMLDLLHAAGVDTVLIGVPKASPGLPHAALFDQIATDKGVVHDNSIIREVLSHDRLKSDEIHPNTEGYKIIAEVVAKLLRGATR